MAYVMVKRGKPVMYQAGERAWVCKGQGHEATGSSQRGAYTRWKNLVALAELSSAEVDRMRATAPRPMLPMGMIR